MRYHDVQDTRKHASIHKERIYNYCLFDKAQRLCTYFGAVFPV